MTGPKRIQMSRQHPWRADNPDAVIVARPSKWGNPFRVMTGRCTISGFCWGVMLGDEVLFDHLDTQAAGRERAVEMFSLHIGPLGLIEWDDATWERMRAELGGRDLACWCPLDQPCHADVLLEIANGERA